MTPPPAGSHAAHGYLDHAATTPVRPEVLAAMAEAMAEPGNLRRPCTGPADVPSRLEAARRAVAERVAVALTAWSSPAAARRPTTWPCSACSGPRLVSAIEHASVLEAVPEATTLPVDAAGRPRLGGLAGLLRGHRPAVVSVMLANNETGVIQPVAEAARLAHAHGSLLHCDAVQAFGKLPFTLAGLGADLLTVSAHKIGGPPGVGALVLRDGLEPVPLQRGGGQELRRRAGTENLPGIVGFAGRSSWRPTGSASVGSATGSRRRHGRCTPRPSWSGAGADRLPNITCLLTPGLSAEVQLMALDLAGVAVSSGAACSSGKVGPSHVLAAMGFTPELARCAIRVSLGWSSTAADVKRFADAWGTLLARRSGRAASPVPA